MGNLDVKQDLEGEQRRRFTRSLLDDVQALERMLDEGLLESGIRRIGAEQELFLIDAAKRPAPISIDVLERLNNKAFTTELARFNLEFNLDPLVLGADCLSRMENEIVTHLALVREAAKAAGADVALVGILPTLEQGHMTLANMTPMERYFALNRALCELRGEEYELSITGVDELNISHESVMLEACNTSFQIHFQVSPEEFARFYNIAQAVCAPVLSAAANAPLLFGRKLWQETRIALFEQSIDTRRETAHARQALGRVSFGRSWVNESVLEIYREDIGRFKVLLGLVDTVEDPFEALEAGRAPRLQALQLHCGTVYRWNRACYGVTNGKPHLRIENRVLPSGPTPLDEVANAAFFFGLLSGVLEEHGDITKHMSFADAKANFLAAARRGLNAQFDWLDKQSIPAHELICNRLIPLAREGLQTAGIRADDVDRYLSVIEARVSSRRTGAQWMLDSLDTMKGEGTRGQRMASLVGAIVERQSTNQPAHTWELAPLVLGQQWREDYQTVEQYMATDLFTVDQDEPVDLVANLMVWNHLRQVPVEDQSHNLVGIVSTRSLLRILAKGKPKSGEPTPVGAIMRRDPVSVSPGTSTLEAIRIMRAEEVSCLPVVTDGKLVGLVTETDFLKMASRLIEEKLEDS